MKIESFSGALKDFTGDAIVVGIWQEEELPAHLAGFDDSGLVSRLLEKGELSAKSLDTTLLYGVGGADSPALVIVGLGIREIFDSQIAYRAAGAAAKLLAVKQRQSVCFCLGPDHLDYSVAGAMVGCVGQDLFKSEAALHPIARLAFATDDVAAVERGEVIGQSINLARRLVNLPAEDIYPESFADACQEMADEVGLEFESWDQQRLTDERCNAHLAVARGSDRPARLVILKHQKGNSDQPLLALVGKGVTFDSGGLSLKPSDGMLDMKCDMAGAAAVVGAMHAIARLNLPVNVIGLAGLAENMVSGNSYKLGDVIRARNGKTIEIHNTDAEGRLVLADTLDVAVSKGADRIIDLATLTGSCMVALGRHVSGVMTNDQEFCDQVLQSAKAVGETVWQLPMFPEYGDQIKSKVADIKNVGDGRWGGAITAGKFLQEFVGETSWVHIDIAGPSFQDSPRPWIDAGASGCLVTTLVEVARQHSSDA